MKKKLIHVIELFDEPKQKGYDIKNLPDITDLKLKGRYFDESITEASLYVHEDGVIELLAGFEAALTHVRDVGHLISKMKSKNFTGEDYKDLVKNMHWRVKTGGP